MVGSYFFSRLFAPVGSKPGKAPYMPDGYVARPGINFRLLLSGLIAGVLLLACNAKSSTPDEATLEKEKKAIMATIEKETQSFFARNYSDWSKTYAQTDYAFQAWSNPDGTFDASVGWDKINSVIGKYITDNPEPQSSHPKVERKNITFKFYGDNAAFLTWDQFNSTRAQDSFHHSKEIRVMEKVDGDWKIVCVGAFWDYKHLIAPDKLPMIQRMDEENRGKGKL